MTTDFQRTLQFLRVRKPTYHYGEASAAITWEVPGAICCAEGRTADEATDRAASGIGITVVPTTGSSDLACEERLTAPRA